MKIALVHDYLVQYGGAERVLECFSELFPYAPIYTLVYNKKLMHGVFDKKDIRTSFLQKIPFSKSSHRIFPQFMPMAIEQFDFSKYDIVLSDSSSYSKGIITGPETLHICYMHTPMRYAWDDCQKYTQDFYFPGIIKKIIPFVMNYIRLWDRISADRADRLIANSNFVAKRIKKYYKRECKVIHPPVNIKNFVVSQKKGDYFLMVGRLLAYKRHDLVIQAFNKSGKPLKIIGRGPESKRLKKIAKDNIEFLGRVSDEELAEYYSNCRAFIFPQEEDFGIVAIEAMASGKPLIAFRGGDILEHAEENKTAVFFDKQTPEALAEALERFEKLDFSQEYLREKMEKFDRSIFKAKIKAYLDQEYANFKAEKYGN
ncbi:MAG: glycosyltransferase family 4 protein [Candidatus Moranbacteria bacterium CG10_big_fil_rev_8_21_14_0_10_35_21]|nr:MAG: glycosyltransferase family 4 protein [Candidatus Moranbacteria bacterium CG10_big_fil_rev_8_21_14_0_10_35_21]PJA88694.1 MAG: glycosyltransferase family 4 protein [Candidatus Moranbacteria bacterium CG_4_9_14_3_um_filter_36_9]